MSEATILFTGDFYGGGALSELIINDQFETIFGDFREIISKNDLAITNLESPLLLDGTPIEKSGPALKAHPKSIDALKFAGFNLLMLANNHILDYGIDGLRKTIDLLDAGQVNFTGAGLTKDQVRTPFIQSISGTKFSFLNFCENEWSTAVNKEGGANPLNLVDNFYDIKKAKSNSDFVIVNFHGGNELFSLPSPNMKEKCRYFVDVGADVVICHHTHYYSGYERYNDGLICYGLGNFLFDNKNIKNPLWNAGIAVQLRVQNDQTFNFEIIPYHQCKNELGVRLLSGSEKNKVLKHIDDLNKIIADDSLLQIEYLKFCKKLQGQYLGQIQPYQNRYLYAAFKRGYLPTAFSKDKYRLLLNLIRCESHRELLIHLLNKKIQ